MLHDLCMTAHLEANVVGTLDVASDASQLEGRRRAGLDLNRCLSLHVHLNGRDGYAAMGQR